MCNDDAMSARSHGAARRYTGDTARANWSSVVAGLFTIALAFTLALPPVRMTDTRDLLSTVYLAVWPVFTVIYLVWTHLSYSRRKPHVLRGIARREHRLEQTWQRVLGFGNASSWTLSSALVAIVLTVVVAQNPTFRENLIYIVLGLVSVASSWALMVYSFALQYLRLHSQIGGDRHLTLQVEDDPRFEDFLTTAVLVSTMAVTVPATMHTRRAWRVIRTNVVFAFVFNSVIVAMMVSLLFGSIT